MVSHELVVDIHKGFFYIWATLVPRTTESIMASIQYRYYDRRKGDFERIRHLVETHLSEPYSIFTYHFFLHHQPHLCRVAYVEGQEDLVGVIIGKISDHRGSRRGYIGMLAVVPAHREKSIGSSLASHLVETMIEEGVDEIVLETEVSNQAALALYCKLGFVREKRLGKYYLNGSDAFRLKLWTSSI